MPFRNFVIRVNGKNLGLKETFQDSTQLAR
jgi:hypothetical protein